MVGISLYFIFINDQRGEGGAPWFDEGSFYTFKNKLCTFVPQTAWSWVWGVKVETKMNIKAFASIW